MRITINGSPLDWPKPVMTEAQLRAYADASPADELYQADGVGRAVKIAGAISIYEGARFRSVPKKVES